MATSASMGLLAPVGKPLLIKICAGPCDGPIPLARLLIHPDAVYCARCQEAVGDVPTYRAPKQRPSYHFSYAQHGLGLLNDDSKAPRCRETIGTIPWSAFAEPEQVSGLAKNTGQHVISVEGQQAMIDATKRRHAARG